MKILCLLLLYLIISGVVSVLMGWQVLHKEDAKEDFEKQLKSISEEITNGFNNKWIFTRDDSLVLYYLVVVFFGFFILPCSIIRRLLRGKAW